MATVTRLAYSDTPGTPTTKTVLTIPSAQPIGTYLALFVCSSGGSSTFTLVDTAGNTWTQREYASNSASPSAVIAVYTTPDTGLTTALTTSDTLTLSSSAGSGAGDMLLVKVVPDPGGTLAFHNGSTGTGTVGGGGSPGVTSFTPTATDVILSGLCTNSTTLNSGTTAGTGFTKIAGVDAHVQNRSLVGQYGTAAGGGTTATYAAAPGANPYASVAIALTQTAPAPGEFVGEIARYSYESTSTKTVDVPVINAVAAGQSVIMGINVPAAVAETAMTATDSKGNTWHTVPNIGVSGPANAQTFIVYCSSLTTGLTTSDTITLDVGAPGTASARWMALGIAYEGILGFDKGASNSGTGQNPDSGTTAAAAQNRQLVFVAFGGTGTGVTQTSIPSGFVANPPVTTPTTVRNLWIVSGFVNASGTRHVVTHNSDNASHAWAGTIGAFNSNASDPYAEYLLIPDVENGDGTGWAPAILKVPSGSGWAL